MRKSLTQFVICIAILFLLATPLFFWLTKSFYAEDMVDIITAVQTGQEIPKIDLERDIMQGVMIQFVFIAAILGIAIIVMIHGIARKLWLPFEATLRTIETFRLEDGTCPILPESDIKEFDRLNKTLNQMMNQSLQSYNLQKEFTENASHELQTPLAIFQTKLDLLLQLPDLTEQQAYIIQDLYRINSRISRLSRNLLLLAKIENNQFATTEDVDLIGALNEWMPYLTSMAGELTIVREYQVPALPLNANRSLLESLINNLFVNAIRHNKEDGMIYIKVTAHSLTIRNTSLEKALDTTRLFNRFHRNSPDEQGNGLGLAIVKAVCDYHGWCIMYDYQEHTHAFRIMFD